MSNFWPVRWRTFEGGCHFVACSLEMYWKVFQVRESVKRNPFRLGEVSKISNR